MGRSFFNESTDAELFTGSRAFAAKIGLTPSAYGISDEQAEAYAELDGEWQAAYRAARDPSMRTSGKVAAKNEARVRLTAMASSLAKIIGGNTGVSDAQRIDLGLSVRAKASPLPAPGRPEGLTVTLYGNGSLVLTWTCDNPRGSRGTQYEVWRTIGGGGFSFLGTVGVKRFVDSTLPAGAVGIIYKIRAARSTQRGEWTQFPIQFGGAPRNVSDLQLAA